MTSKPNKTVIAAEPAKASTPEPRSTRSMCSRCPHEAERGHAVCTFCGRPTDREVTPA